MKLSNFTAKLTSMKSTTVRVLAAATLAGATLLAAAPAAQAQQVFVGAHFGPPMRGPVYVAPAPRYDYWAHRRFEEERFHHDFHRW